MGMPFHGWRWPMSRTAIVSSLLLASCVGSLPDVSPESDITVGTNLRASLTFRTDGDAPDSPPGGMVAAADTSHLGLAQALERAVLADADIQAALARVHIARADADQARLLPNPVLDFVLRWGKSQNQIEVSFAQALLGVLQRPRKASAADARLRRAATEALVVGLDVANSLQRCYAEAQAADAISDLLAEQLQLLDRLVALADNRLKNGEGTQSERTSLFAQKLGIDLRLAAARQRQHELRLQLARCIGEPSSHTSWTLDPWQPPEAVSGDETSWLRTALTQRPELQALRFELAALGDEHALALWAPWQDAAIGANVQRAPTWVGGPVLTVPLPIFDLGDAAANRVTAEQVEVRHQLTGEMRRVIEEVRVAFSSYHTHRDNLQRVTEQLLPLHKQRQQQAETALRLGMADASASLQIAQERQQAQQTAIELERDTTFAWLRLMRAAAGLPAGSSPDDRNPQTNPEPNLPSTRGAAEER
jgi:outer membrane protein, heavy metal efflux system